MKVNYLVFQVTPWIIGDFWIFGFDFYLNFWLF